MAVSPAPTPAADRWDLPDVLLVPTDSVDGYLARIHTLPTLTPAAEAVLGRAVQAGDRAAAVQLALHNLRYAAYLARRWEDRPPLGAEPVWSLADGIQAANIGLWHAVQRYDPAVARFTTYATWWIRQAWDRARHDFLWQVRLPAHAVTRQRAVQRAQAAWQQTHGTPPTPADLAALLGWPVEQVAFWLAWDTTANRLASLDAPVGEDTTLGDLLPDDAAATVWDRLDHWAQQQAVDQLLAHLPAREADVLRLRFGLVGAPMTLQDIANLFRLSRERVRQLEQRALTRLRDLCARHPEWGIRDLLDG